MIYYSTLATHIRRNIGRLVLIAVLGGALSFGVFITVPDAYQVRTDFLVIQESAVSQDFYTLSKSAEYSGNVLKEAILSDLFYREASQKNYFSTVRFSGDEKDRLKAWRNAVEVKQRASAGILEVSVTDDSRENAVGVARAISEVLIEKNDLFRSGAPEALSIKLISGPIVEQNPSVSQLIAGVFAGMIFGSAIGVLWIWYREEWDHTDYNKFSNIVTQYQDDTPKARPLYDEHLPEMSR